MTAPFLFVPTFSWPAAPGGLLYTYAAGGTTPKTTYNDAAGSTPNTNPVVLDANGSATVRLGSGSYHFLLKDSTGTTTLWDQDQYSASFLTAADIGALLYPRTAAEIAGSITPANYSYPTTPGHHVLRYSGVVADKVTDCTSALLTAMNAIGGAFVIPPNVLYDTKTLLASLDTDVVILDYSIINDYTSGGSTAKRVGITSSDTSANDTSYAVASGHHPSFEGNNFGTAGTSSATSRVFSIDWMAGQFRNGGLTQRGSRFAAHHTYSKDGNVWAYQLISDAPWSAIAAEYELWSSGMAVTSGVTYCVNSSHIYVSATTGTASATPPTHTSGTANGWTWVDDVGRNVFRIDENGRTLFGSGSYTYQWNYFGTARDAGGGQVAINWQAVGASNVVEERWTPSTAGGAASPTPFLRAQDGVGLRFFNSGITQEVLRLTESGGCQIPTATFSVAMSSTSPTVSNNGTINTAALGATRVAPAGAVTGIILQAGTVDGQTIRVINEAVAANTVTFAAVGTSNVAGGTGVVIAGQAQKYFTWGAAAARWYPN